ncbi:MAG: hypothetical protein HQL60_01190 [Magnetococcales bacterium]|nr:hypothetical protein [Magnetococcales bacterium]
MTQPTWPPALQPLYQQWLAAQPAPAAKTASPPAAAPGPGTRVVVTAWDHGIQGTDRFIALMGKNILPFPTSQV